MGNRIAFVGFVMCVFGGGQIIFAQTAPSGSAPGPGRGALSETPDPAPHPIRNSPGVSMMQIAQTAAYQIVRDFFEPKAVRQMHWHKGSTYHVVTVAQGTIEVHVQGEQPQTLKAGDVLRLKAEVIHGFKNVGDGAATVVEVFGKGNPGPLESYESGPLK